MCEWPSCARLPTDDEKAPLVFRLQEMSGSHGNCARIRGRTFDSNPFASVASASLRLARRDDGADARRRVGGANQSRRMGARAHAPFGADVGAGLAKNALPAAEPR